MARARLLPGLFFVALSLPLRAQESGTPPSRPYEPIRQDALGSRLINLATPLTVGARTLEVIFTHRFNIPINDGNEHNLWGLDGSADIGIGMTLGVTPNLDLALYRSSFQENYELAAKFLALRQAPRVPLSIAVRLGASRLEADGARDRDRPFAQLLLSRRLRPGCNILLAPSWVAETERLRNAFNVPLGVTLGLRGGYLIELEFIAKNRDLAPGASENYWQAAFSKGIGGHIFEITLGNSRATTVDQYLGGDFAGGFEPDDVRLGFNIVRDFKF